MSQPDMNDILARAAEMQEKLQEAQQEILDATVEGTAGNGLVTVVMSGGAEVQDVKIDPEVVDPEDIETLQDLVLGAFRDAHQKAGDLAQEKIGPFSEQGGAGGMLG